MARCREVPAAAIAAIAERRIMEPGLLSVHIAALMIGVQRAISLLTSAASGC